MIGLVEILILLVVLLLLLGGPVAAGIVIWKVCGHAQRDTAVPPGHASQEQAPPHGGAV